MSSLHLYCIKIEIEPELGHFAYGTAQSSGGLRMSSRIAVVSTRFVVATCIALAFTLCLLGTVAAAQDTIQPKDELFGGYSWLHTNGYVDFGYRSPDIADGFDISNVYYLPGMAHNLGVLADFSYHWDGRFRTRVSTTSTSPTFWADCSTSITPDTFSPFVRVFVGTVDHAGGNGTGSVPSGVPAVGRRRRLRFEHYAKVLYPSGASGLHLFELHPAIPFGHDTQWNSIRLAAGIVLNLGNYYNPPLSCTASATPD